MSALHLIQSFGSGTAVFLIGVNTAFLLHLGGRLVSWFRFKISAVTGMLGYIAWSMWAGNPSTGRTCLGIVVMAVDLVAIGLMWRSILKNADRGVIGLVPVLLDDHKN